MSIILSYDILILIYNLQHPPFVYRLVTKVSKTKSSARERKKILKNQEDFEFIKSNGKLLQNLQFCDICLAI